MTAKNTQMTPNSIEVFERLSGWTRKSKYPNDNISLDKDGVMWMRGENDLTQRLEHMELDGETYVREPV